MDVGRLAEAIGYLVGDEEDYSVQEKLVALESALQNLSSSPAEQSFQVALTERLDALAKAISELESTYNPSQLERVIEIGARPFFTQSLVGAVRRSIRENPMTPASALATVARIRQRREAYLEKLNATKDGIEFFKVAEMRLEPGEAEIGFELPREIFGNDFHFFLAELKNIERVVRVFSEVETGSSVEIELGNISSTDPLIFLQLPPVVVLSISASIGWLLSQWKKFEEIRKLRAETAKINSFSEEELSKFFDDKIKKDLDASIEIKVKELLDAATLDAGRKNELQGELERALRSLYARIERGMRIEVDVNPPPKLEEPTAEQNELREQALRVRERAHELAFPSMDAAAVLALPKLHGGEQQDDQDKL